MVQRFNYLYGVQTMIAIYDKTTGDVRQFVTCPPEEYSLNVREGEDFIEVDAPAFGSSRVVDGAVVLVE